MLDHIQDKSQIKAILYFFYFFLKVCKFELQSVVGSTLGQFKCLRRDVVSAENTIAVQSVLKLLQDFSCAATHVADGFWGKMVLPKHAENLSCLPRGLFNMPPWILRKIFSIEINRLTGHGAFPSTWQAEQSVISPELRPA